MDLSELQKIFPNATEDTWHRHINGGGWVQNTAGIVESVYVEKDALVYDNAQLYENVKVYGHVYGNACICGKANLCKNARVRNGFWTETPFLVKGIHNIIQICAPEIIMISSSERSIDDWVKFYKKAKPHLFGYLREIIDEWYAHVKSIALLRDKGAKSVMGG